MNWRFLTRKDFAAIVLLIVILGAALFVYVKSSSSGRKSNWGFGPEWTCTDRGDGRPVCVKSVPAGAGADSSN